MADKKGFSYDHDFLMFCVKQILSDGNLIGRVGRTYELREPVAGVDPGELFPTMEAACESIIGTLRFQYQQRQQSRAA